jgi:hypothetical protein
VRESRSAFFWGVLLPAAAVGTTLLWWPWGGALFLAYPLQVIRLLSRTDGPWSLRARRAVFLVIGKLAEGVGLLKYHSVNAFGRQGSLIEYK